MTLDDGFQERWILCRIILKIGVLDDDDVSRRESHSFTDSRPFAVIDLSKDDLHARDLQPALQLAQDLAGSIGRSVVNDDDLFLQWDSFDPVQNFPDRPEFIEYRHNDR